jgi:hypothetical protein
MTRESEGGERARERERREILREKAGGGERGSML